MARQRLTAEKAQQRRQAKSARKIEKSIQFGAVSGAGMSLIEKLEQEATDAAKNYLKAKGDEDPEYDWTLPVMRGILRGTIVGVAMIRAPYELRDNRAKVLKQLEREFVKRAQGD